MTTTDTRHPVDRTYLPPQDVAAVLLEADERFVRARRDTPAGTIIGRLDPVAQRDMWLALRRTGIGSSDVPVLLGLSSGEYAKSELDLYMDKRGEAGDDESGEAALWGNLLEDPVAREWARRAGVRVHRVGTIARQGHRHMLCDLDRQVIGCTEHDRCALEVKTRSAYVADKWRDGVPEAVEAQTMWQLAVTGYDAVHVAALIGGQRLVDYVVTPDEAYIADLHAIADQFWNENVVAGVPPVISSLELLIGHLSKLTPEKGAKVLLDGAEAATALGLTELIDRLKGEVADELEVAQNELKALIGEDATELVVLDGDREVPLWTWRWQNKPKVLDKAALEAAAGAPLDAFKVPNGTTRVLRRVKAKEKR